MVYLIGFIAGTALVMTTLVYVLLNKIVYSNKLKVSIASIKKRLIRKRNPSPYDKFPLYGALAGIICATLLMWNNTNPRMLIVFMCAGAIIGIFSKQYVSKENQYTKLRNALLFFKAIAVRFKCGYNPTYTLRMAGNLVPEFRPAVHRCLQEWSFNPKKAVENLRDELNIPQTKTLFQVLIQARNVGGENVADTIDMGTRNLNNKIAEMEEKSFAKGKMRYLFWRVLPVLAIVALFTGNFAYYAHVTLEKATQGF